MKKFTLGMVAGMSSLALAVPILAQVTSAQTGEDVVEFSPFIAAEAIEIEAVTPTQQCALAMADLEDAHLANFDATTATHKAQLQARATTLRSAAAISDDTERAEALKAMHEEMRSMMEDREPSEAITTAMDAVKEACGDVMGFRMAFGPGMGGMHMGKPFMMKLGRGPMAGDLAEKLGMTAEELKAAIDSGKTIEEIAEEKGIELPARPGHRGYFQKFLQKEDVSQ